MENTPISVEVFHSAFGDGFKKVAEVASDKPNDIICELELAFNLTNTINRDWRQNIDFTNGVFEPSENASRAIDGVRSTSAGDYMAVHMANGDIKWYNVAGIGFTEVSDKTMVDYTYYERSAASKGYVRKFTRMSFQKLRALGDQ